MKKAKCIGKKIVVFMLVLMMFMSVAVTGLVSVSAATDKVAQTGAESASDTRTIYFSSNGYWNNLLAVYAWTEGTDACEWKALDKVEGVDDLWSVELSVSYTNATFCSRNYPGFSESAIAYKTGELTLQENYNLLTLTGETTAVWGYYNADDTPEDAIGTQKIYFTPNEEWTDIQGTLYHDFVVRAWSDASADSILVQCDLIEGKIGEYPTVWVAEIPANYDNVKFLRAESAMENGFYVWEETDDQVVPTDSNLFSQLDDTQTGTWSYYIEKEVNPDEPEDEPENPTPDIQGETQILYFTPNAEWLSYIEESEGKLSAAYQNGDSQAWVFASKVTDGVYMVEIPAEDTSVVFGVSFGATADLVWVKTNAQTIPAGKDYFKQDSSDSLTGTWSVYRIGEAGVYYSVAFVDYDGTLLSAQAVMEGASATAPENPSRKNDSRYKYTFKGWDKSFENVQSDIIVTAQYERVELPPVAAATTGKLRIEVAGGTSFTIAVNGGNARPQGTSYTNTKMTIGANVTLVAKGADNLEFLGWVNDAGVVQSTEETYTFSTTGNDYVKAMYKTPVDGVNSVIFKNDRAAGGKGHVIDMQYYAAGDEVIFPAAPSLAGYDFMGWNMTAEDIQQKLAAGEDVVVLATWKLAQVYVNVSVEGGTITYTLGQNSEGQYRAYNRTIATANAAEAGMKFAYWADENGNILSYKTDYEFYPAADMSIKAVYVTEDTAVEITPVVTLSADPTTEGEKITYYLLWDVDQTAVGKVTGLGIIIVDKADYNEATFVHGTTDSKVFDRAFANKVAQSGVYAPVKTGSVYDHTYVAAMWLTYTDVNTGESVTVYSPVIEAYKPAP